MRVRRHWPCLCHRRFTFGTRCHRQFCYLYHLHINSSSSSGSHSCSSSSSSLLSIPYWPWFLLLSSPLLIVLSLLSIPLIQLKLVIPSTYTGTSSDNNAPNVRWALLVSFCVTQRVLCSAWVVISFVISIFILFWLNAITLWDLLLLVMKLC